MIKESEVKVRWNPRNKKYLEGLGFHFSSYKEYAVVPVERLSIGIHAKITAICDLCRNEKEMEYKTYLYCHDKMGYYCCKKCTNIKQSESMVEKYGVENPFQLEQTKEKIRESNLSKYNVEYTMQRKDMKEKYLNGSKNIFYIDGRNSLAIDRSNSSYKKWRKKILIFYNNKCLSCGSNFKLRAHHIVGYSTDVSKALDTNNGVCLCEKCHRDFHKMFGFGHNTEEQFLIWLSLQASYTQFSTTP